MKKKLTIGTRGSKLALAQADIVSNRLKDLVETDIRTIKTSGDIDQTRSVIDLGGKGVFIKEIERELLSGNIDVAVHSLKDMPARCPEGLCIGAYIPAEDRRDVLISTQGLKLDQLPPGSQIGTGSPRRRMQLAMYRDDLKIVPIRGNIDTRIAKVENGQYDGVILALQGLKRLGLQDKAAQVLETDEIIPAPGQGVIAVEAKSDNEEILDILRVIDDASQRLISEIEFDLLKMLGATCHTPIGMDSQFEGDNISINLFLGDEDLSRSINKIFAAPIKDRNKTIKILFNHISEEWYKSTGKELKIR